MLTLSFWYKRVALKEVKKIWMDLTPLLGFERVGKRAGSGSWDYVLLNDGPVFFGIGERMDKHVVVNIFSRQDALVPYLEVALKRLYKQRHICLPSESYLVEGVEESSGPLLSFCKTNPEELFERVALHFTPQIRVVDVALCGGLRSLERILGDYATGVKIVRDNLWLDFGWSRFSNSWNLGAHLFFPDGRLS